MDRKKYYIYIGIDATIVCVTCVDCIIRLFFDVIYFDFYALLFVCRDFEKSSI